MYYHLPVGQEGINAQAPPSTKIQLLLVLGKWGFKQRRHSLNVGKKKVRKIENIMKPTVLCAPVVSVEIQKRD